MAYRADIEIAVRGAQELKRLQDQVSATSKLVDGLNNYLQNIGDGGVVRSIDNLNKTVADTAAAFNKAALETDEAALAARNFVAANRQLTQGLEARLTLLKNIAEEERRQRLGAAGIRETTQYAGPIGPGPASPVASLVGQKSPVEEIIRRTIEARKDERQLKEALLRLEEKSAGILNKELTARREIARMSAAGVVAATVRAGQPSTPLALPAFQERGLQLLNDSVRANESNRRIEQAVNGERQRGVRFLEKQTAEERRQVELGILGQRTNRLGGIRPDSGFIPPFPPKAKGMFQGIPAKGLAGFLGKPGVPDALMGAGFPLLFGGGPGAILGGGLGGFIGGKAGGMGGMALGIAASAVGQLLDKGFQQIAAIAASLDTLNMDALRESVITVNAALDYQVEALVKAGKADEARALAAAEVTTQTGISAQQLESINGNAVRLKNEFDKTVGSLQGTGAILGNIFLPALTDIVNLVGMVARGWNLIFGVVIDSGQGLKGWFQNLVFGEGTAQKVKEKFGGINEEQQKLSAELARTVDTLLRSAQLGKKLQDIDKQRTLNVSLMGKYINIEADRREKIANAESQAAQRKADERAKYGKLLSDQDRRNLADVEKLIEAEKKQTIGQANRNALKERFLALNATLIEQDRVRIALLQMQGEIAKASEDANDKVRAGQIQELEQRKQIALTLTDELSAVNSIYTQKKQGIDAAYAAAKREADLKVQTAALDLASIEAQKARGQATAEQVAQARNVYNTAVAVTQETLRGAAAVKSAATSAADLERRQQTVAAYTGQFAREAAAATQKLNEAAAASTNMASVSQAMYQAQTTLNNVNIQSLQATLATTRNLETRAIIIDKIRRLEIDNAELAYLSAISQIQAQVESLRIAYEQVRVRYMELQAVVAIARAQKVLNQGHLDALNAQRSALRIAAGNLDAGREIARWNELAAKATYRGAVSAANLRASTALAARDAGSFAGSMENAASNMQKMTGMSYSRPGLEDWQERYIAKIVNAAGANKVGFTFGDRVTLESQLFRYFNQGRLQAQAASDTQQLQEFQAKYGAAPYGSAGSALLQTSMANIGMFASGGYVTGPTLGLIGEGGQSEYIIPENKMSLASANYLAGGRGAGIMEGGGGGSAPSINITTGPVVEFNGERYVTMRDMERGLQQMATNIYSGLRTPSGRYAVGVRN